MEERVKEMWYIHTMEYYLAFLIFFKDFIDLFLERWEGKEKGRETSTGCLSHASNLGIWPATQAYALTGNPTGDPLVCRPALHPLSHTSQGSLFKK